MQPTRILLLYANPPEARLLAYQRGWPRAFAQHRAFECISIDILSKDPRAWARVARGGFRAVVVLHSVFSNAQYLGGARLRLVAALRAPKAVFLGNEYKLMPEKMAFAERLGVDLLVSQLTSPQAHELYRERLGCRVAYITNAGLDPELFSPRRPSEERPVDLGYRAYASPLSLGHDERRELAERAGEAARRHGLQTDISLDPADRLDERGWAGFLNSCKGQLGSEAGGDYFELSDRTRLAVNAHLERDPDASSGEIRERFFAAYGDAVSGRALSGRIVEAAGTKTTQVLLEGEYGGYFQPDVHYISLRKDFANVDEALAKLVDRSNATRLAENAYEVARAELTYDRLIDRFTEALEEVL